MTPIARRVADSYTRFSGDTPVEQTFWSEVPSVLKVPRFMFGAPNIAAPPVGASYGARDDHNRGYTFYALRVPGYGKTKDVVSGFRKEHEDLKREDMPTTPLRVLQAVGVLAHYLENPDTSVNGLVRAVSKKAFQTAFDVAQKSRELHYEKKLPDTHLEYRRLGTFCVNDLAENPADGSDQTFVQAVDALLERTKIRSSYMPAVKIIPVSPRRVVEAPLDLDRYLKGLKEPPRAGPETDLLRGDSLTKMGSSRSPSPPATLGVTNGIPSPPSVTIQDSVISHSTIVQNVTIAEESGMENDQVVLDVWNTPLALFMSALIGQRILGERAEPSIAMKERVEVVGDRIFVPMAEEQIIGAKVFRGTGMRGRLYHLEIGNIEYSLTPDGQRVAEIVA